MSGKVRSRAESAATLLLAAAAATLFVIAVRPLMLSAADPFSIFDDQRGWVSVFQRYRDAGLFPTQNLVVDTAEALAPPGYAWLLRTLAPIVPPLAAAKWLGVGIMVLSVLLMGAIARRCAGGEAALATLALSTHAFLFVDRAAGGLHRSFGYPVAAGALWALAGNRPAVAITCVAAGALFYPPAALIAAPVAVFLLVRLPRRRSPRTVGLWMYAVVGGLVTLGILIDWTSTYTELGAPITYAKALSAPEWHRPGGRFPYLPLDSPFREIMAAAALAFRTTRAPLPSGSVVVICGTLFAGVIAARMRLDPPVRNVVIFGVMGAGLYLIARVVAFRLYMPQRYLALTIPLVVLTLWPWAWKGIWARLHPNAPPALAALCALVIGVLLAGKAATRRELYVVSTGAPQAQALIGVLRLLPPETLLTGAPRLMDTLAATAFRPTYVSYEVVLPGYPRQFSEIRRRCRRHFEAYYAPTPAALRRLHEEEGVDIMIVKREDFVPPVRPPGGLFEPVTSDVQEILDANAQGLFWLARPPAECIMADLGAYLVVDLAAVPAGPR